MEVATNVYRFIVRPKERPGEQAGPRERALAADARALGLRQVRALRPAVIYFVRGTIAPKELELLGRFLFSDPVAEDCRWSLASAPASSLASASGEDSARAAEPSVGVRRRLEVALRPGVTDPVADEALRGALELGVHGVEAVSTGEAYEVEGKPGSSISDDDLRVLAERLLCNGVIQRWAIGEIAPEWPADAAGSGAVERLDLAGMDDGALAAISAERRAALDLTEMRAIRDYYRRLGREATDAEFETIAQTWSEHCVHKTFKARIEVKADADRAAPYPPVVDNVLKSYIKKATDEIAAPWVLSAFVDNAGVIDFDGEHELSFKVETHNHPSAIEPFGGANTGVGGVIRDVMGVSARPVAATDVLCFGSPDADPASLPAGCLHPQRIASGVVAGVQDYGNKMGIPTVNGGIHYDPGYAANPLVYCGCAGIAPKGRRPRAQAAGDLVVVLGGRTGRDGLRGATFSSLPMDSSTGEVCGASVQIGAPIVQKKVAEVLEAARDAGLYTAVTDCGAGGLSSAVGEMGAELGVDVDLAKAPLKYPGLAPWEIWLSEAQERMVVAVPPDKADALRGLCDGLDVEMTELGRFSGDGRLVVRYEGVPVVDLDCAFLHAGPPQRRLVASPGERPAAYSRTGSRNAGEAPAEALLAILSHPAVASREPTVRLYDHEVQGATVLGPYDGVLRDGPQDAAVLKPREAGGAFALALGNGFNQRYGAVDPYRMAVSVVDEAVRNAVAVGADPDRVAILDNFCLGDPTRPETMWDLIESARGCYDAAVALGTPFISGKDSFNNEYLAAGGERTSIPPSLLISSIGIVPDASRVPGSDLKSSGDPLYLVGTPQPSFGGSIYAELYGLPPMIGGRPTRADALPPAAAPEARETYRALHAAIVSGLVRACHDLSDGGLAATVAEMCLGGGLGASVDASATVVATAALFGETNGCLVVEVDMARETEFQALMAGVACSRLGEVGRSGRLVLRAGDAIIDLGLDDIKAAYAGKGGEA